jgi:hypothetical protein
LFSCSVVQLFSVELGVRRFEVGGLRLEVAGQARDEAHDEAHDEGVLTYYRAYDRINR